MSAAFGKLHPKIQEAIWQRKWDELRPLQVDAINAVFDGGGDIILAAATASGKTEAAFLPILSQLVDSADGSVGALYISPLKALINDQFRRIEELCEYADIPVHRWHGDVSATEKRRLREKPGGVLLITPESLESQFINYTGLVARIYSGLKYIVIDELHSFLDNVRGIHLRSLLARLEIDAGVEPRRIGLSATIGDFTPACAFLNVDRPESVQVIQDKTARKELRIGLKAFLEGAKAGDEAEEDSDEPKGLGAIAEDVAMNFRGNANLVFCNSRRQTEMLTDKLRHIRERERWAADPFYLHHGSLSKDLRLEAEESLKSGRPITAICTSTLEMGIDLGAVTAIGQVGPTWTVSSLVQRLGRSGRREGEAQILRMFTLDDEITEKSSLTDRLYPELIRGIAMIELLLEKWLEPSAMQRCHYSTCVHQVLSILRQTGGAMAADLYDKLCVRGAFRSIEMPQFLILLRGLKQADLLEQIASGEIILAPEGERIVEARDFYAAFISSVEFKVESDGQAIGMLPEDSIPAPGEFLLLAGRRWQVVDIYQREKVVLVKPARGWKKPQFNGGGGGLHRQVMEKMRKILASDGGYSFLHKSAGEMLGSARLAFATAGLNERDVLEQGNSITIYPWAGSSIMESLALFAKAAEMKVSADNLSITYEGVGIEEVRLHWRTVADGKTTDSELLEQCLSLERDRFDKFIPRELLGNALLTESLDIVGARQLCRKSYLAGRFSPNSLR